MKKVSIVMCTYNGEKYLKEQIDSILNQTYPLEELIIQDDCSTDSTVDIIREYQKKYPIIKLHVNEENKGLNENFFSAMSKANGDYIATADQDDIWELNKIEKQVDAIGDCLLCFGRSRFFNNEDETTIVINKESQNYSLVRFVFVSTIAGHVMLFSSKLLKLMPLEGNLIRDKYKNFDHYLGLTAVAYNSVVFCNEILCHHRIHAGNLTLNLGESVEPKKTIFRPLKAIQSAFTHRKNIKKEADIFFLSTYEYISELKVETKETRDAKKIALLMAGSSFFSIIRAMIFCVIHKDKVLDENKPGRIVALIKAPLFPLLCYNFYKF